MWDNIRALSGQTLNTLDRRRPFQVLSVTNNDLVIHVNTSNKRRTIHRKEVEAVWMELIEKGEISRSIVREKYSQFNPAYVVAIISQLNGVITETKPIRLHFYHQTQFKLSGKRKEILTNA